MISQGQVAAVVSFLQKYHLLIDPIMTFIPF